jgi:2-polyprenyl-6-methoxyphenol hydroxylase-like FAD-dependent oxidoreductase
MIAATDESAILRNDIYDREPLPRWSENRAALLGYAAHPMTPNLGQGGCHARHIASVAVYEALSKSERALFWPALAALTG